MAKEALYEESAQSVKAKSEARMYTVFHVVSIVFFVLGILYAFVCLLVVPDIIYQYLHPEALAESGQPPMTGAGLAVSLVMWLGMLVMFFLIAFAFFRFKRRFNVSYDYLFVEDELRLTRVFNGKKRKFITTLKSDQILKIGYCDKDSYERTLAGMGGRKPRFMTPNSEPAEDKQFIYILYSSSQEKNIYVLECRQMMLEYLVRAAGMNKFERQ